MHRRTLTLPVVVLWAAAVAAIHADPADDFSRAEMRRQNIPGLSVAGVPAGRNDGDAHDHHGAGAEQGDRLRG
jgi:hypothetical protein